MHGDRNGINRYAPERRRGRSISGTVRVCPTSAQIAAGLETDVTLARLNGPKSHSSSLQCRRNHKLRCSAAVAPLRTKGHGWWGLFLLVTPKGGRCWRYAYRFAQKHKALALGTYREVPLEWVRTRLARNLLAHGLDPSALNAALGKDIFVVTMREWEIARGHMSGPGVFTQPRSLGDFRSEFHSECLYYLQYCAETGVTISRQSLV
jgi:hypothetical protein